MMNKPKTVKSSEIVGSCDDLLTEILLHVPVKSLLDFKLISKQWHSIITSSNFCRQKTKATVAVAVGVFVLVMRHVKKTFYTFVLDYFPFSATGSRNISSPLKELSDITIVQSCNGLLLCYTRTKNYCRSFVCNPSTKQLSWIPESNLRIQTFFPPKLSLAFDPAKSSHYQVVGVNEYSCNGRMFQIQIYSSKTGIWKICPGHFIGLSGLILRPVYWNGAIHWIDNETGAGSYFNIDNQVLNIMPEPPVSRVEYFEESHDHLHLIGTSLSVIQLNVYEMKKDYSEWFVKYIVDLSPLVNAYPVMMRRYDFGNYYRLNYNILYLVRGDEEPFLVLDFPRKVVRYNLVSMTLKTLHEDDLDDEDKNFIGEISYQRRGFHYIESPFMFISTTNPF